MYILLIQLLFVIDIVFYVVLFNVILPKIKFKDENYINNNDLLRLDYEAISKLSMHDNIRGLTVMIAGLTLLSQRDFINNFYPNSLYISLILIIGGFGYILQGMYHSANTERIYRQLRRNLLTKS